MIRADMIRLLAGALLLAALAYGALCAWMYASQRRLVYFPDATRADPAATDFSFERDGVVLRGWTVNPGRAQAIVYFGGNAEAIEGNREAFAHWLPGHTVYLVAYRGYGASDGAPSRAALLDDALALFDHVQSRHPGAPVGVIGRSLGSGVASHVASRRPVQRLVLVTPFDRLGAVAASHYPWLPVRWLLREDYDSVAALRGYRGALLVVRAGRDEVIPPANTDRLVASLPRPPRVVAMADADHNRLDRADYGRALRDFFESR